METPRASIVQDFNTGALCGLSVDGNDAHERERAGVPLGWAQLQGQFAIDVWVRPCALLCLKAQSLVG